jgi:hypothetical protein
MHTNKEVHCELSGRKYSTRRKRKGLVCSRYSNSHVSWNEGATSHWSNQLHFLPLWLWFCLFKIVLLSLFVRQPPWIPGRIGLIDEGLYDEGLKLFQAIGSLAGRPPPNEDDYQWWGGCTLSRTNHLMGTGCSPQVMTVQQRLWSPWQNQNQDSD